MDSLLVYGKYLAADADTIIPGGAAYIEDGRIVETGTFSEISRRRRPDRILGGEKFLVIPGLINAHGHGKGITDFQRGAVDDTLEVWKFRGFPPVDPYWDTLWETTLLVESGVTVTMHNHAPARPREAEEEFRSILDAYRRSGMGVAFAPAVSYRNPFVYGDNEVFVASLPTEVRETAQKIASSAAAFGPEAYFSAVKTLSADYDSPLIRIHHGPMAPQWVDEELLIESKRLADREGRMLFTHVQQTPHQRLYGMKTYGKSLILRMEERNILGKNVVLGHCVWTDIEDIAAMARRGCAVTHHPSCNLRVRNGIAPVYAMLEAGISVGIGMDDKELGDGRDYIEEMRTAAKLHRILDYRPGSPCLTPRQSFRMATEHGARCLGLEKETGVLRPGMRADVVLLDYAAMTEPYTWEGHDPIEVLVQRGKKAHVRTVLVAGKILLREGEHEALSRAEVLRKLRESIPEDYGARFEGSRRDLAPLKEAVRNWFEPWSRELDGGEKRPFYHLNDRGGEFVDSEFSR